MKKSIVVAGVGGQGVITAANIIAKAALKDGYNVVMSELHGMAQRGGNVECNVRIGNVYSPIVASYSADAIISFEPLEALRNLKKVKKEGIVLTDINPIIPPLISLGIGKYPPLNEIFGCLHALKILPIKKESYIETIKETFPEKYVEMNIRAFEIGEEEIKKKQGNSAPVGI